jgi:type I site-specific restriction endonuclease
MDKTALSERDICSKFITPAIQRAGWDLQTQVREEAVCDPGQLDLDKNRDVLVTDRVRNFRQI